MNRKQLAEILRRAEHLCSRRGVRLTPQRRTVLELVCAAEKPMSAYDILDLMYFTGSAEKQDRFYKLLFYELDKSSHPVEFVQGWSVRDMDLGHQRLVDENGEDDLFTEFYKYFRDIGLYDGDGNPRAATQTWLDELALPHVPR